jgi:hypothetical protein
MQISLSAIDGNLREAAAQWCARKGVDPDDLLPRLDTGDLLGVSTQTLAKWASQKKGPPFVSLFGRARYRAIDAVTWLLSQQRNPAESEAVKAVQRRRERGDRIGRPPRADMPIAA